MKLHTVENVPGQLVFQCPACGNCHFFLVEGATRQGPRWTWNGSMDRPTFTPSLLVNGVQPTTDDEIERIKRGEKIEPKSLRCHSYVTDGKIQYLGDCTHAMAGQTVEIPDWDS
jgi:hypothetical protein